MAAGAADDLHRERSHGSESESLLFEYESVGDDIRRGEKEVCGEYAQDVAQFGRIVVKRGDPAPMRAEEEQQPEAPDHNVSEKMPPRSRLSRFLCWMTAGPMPRSLKMAKKAMTTVGDGSPRRTLRG